MCGIAGIVSLSSPIQEQQLLQMSDAIQYRGPDDQGHIILRMGEGQIGLASRRLSIIDLSSAGHMPMSNADQTLWIAYNGEIYNHLDIRKRLEQRGVREFRSRTDTETLLFAYQEFGLDAFSLLDGMFAVAIADLRSGRLVLVRDRMGIKPLYYAWDSKELLFASELKAILASQHIATQIDPKALELYLALGYVPSPYCLVSGVRKLEPGHILILENGLISDLTYWLPKMDIPQPDARSKAHLVEQVHQSLGDAVQAQLMSDVPLGVMLSGGLDSTIVACLASKHLRNNLHTFSVGFHTDNSPLQEEYNLDFYSAREVASQLGTNHHEIVVRDCEELARDITELLVQVDEPLVEASYSSIYLMARAAQKSGVKVLLSGDGADELFGGYPWHWAGLRLERIELLPLLKKPLNMITPLLPDGALRTKMVDLEHKYRQPAWVKYLFNYCYFDSAFRTSLMGICPSDDIVGNFIQDILAPVKGASIADQYAYADLILWVREHFNQRIDRMTMQASIEGRVPFQHNAVVDLALSIGMNRKIRGHVQKDLLRQAFGNQIPENVLLREKRPFAVPMLAWLLGALRDYALDLFSSESVSQVGFLDPDTVQKFTTQMFNYLPFHPEDSFSLLQTWNLLALLIWARALHMTG